MRLDLINKLYNFVILTSRIYNIDESHSLKHSMDVYYYANKIYESELKNHDNLIYQKDIIDISSILHDMCDKKYMNEVHGIKRIECLLKDEIDVNDINIIKDIISTMSYSKVKKNGYPSLNKYQMAYHIVREADLLTSYNFERCIIYNMMKNKGSYYDSLKDAFNIFNNRVLKYDEEGLFITDFSKNESIKLKKDAINIISEYNKIYENFK